METRSQRPDSAYTQRVKPIRGGLLSAVRSVARRQVAALSLAGLVLLLVTAAALAATGDLTQPAGTAGCISETGAGPCADGHALNGPSGVAVSPDGKSVYVASTQQRRGAPQPQHDHRGDHPARRAAGCISETGRGPAPTAMRSTSRASVAVSPDGKSVYVASTFSDAVARFNRNTTTGAITQPAGAAGCISETGAGPCADGHGLDYPSSVAVSPDGKSVYVASSPATPWRASTATRPPGRSPSPPGPPAA